jgi:hypothetical protein
MKRIDMEEKAKVVELAGANDVAKTRTLRELGLPGELARDIEAAFRMVGATRGDQVVGFRFVTPDGRSYGLRQESQPSSTASSRAA